MTNFEHLKKTDYLHESIKTPEAAAEVITTAFFLDCKNCVACDECAYTYGSNSEERKRSDCLNTVLAYLNQEKMKNKEESENGSE